MSAQNQNRENEQENASRELVNLSLLIQHVYYPLETKQELQNTLQKFAVNLQHSASQVQGAEPIKIPDIPFDQPYKEIVSKAQYRELIDHALEDWTNKIKTKLQDAENSRPAYMKSAMDEIEHWRNKSALYSALYQQFTVGSVQKILEIAKFSMDNQLEILSYINYKNEDQRLSKAHAEAKDNVKFLNTLQRQFQNIQSGDLVQIEETLQSLMNGLRLVWTISRHYKDEKMQGLIECITNEILEKVQQEIKVNEIFKAKEDENEVQTVSETIKLIERGIQVLERWVKTFKDTKKEMESNSERWDIDVKKLFLQTNYMTKVLQNLKYVAQCLLEFYSFLGDDLQKVTGKNNKIKEVRQNVKDTIAPIENFENIFSSSRSKEWESVFKVFNEKVSDIEQETITLIEESFTDLRDSESAFDLIQHLKSVQTREQIGQTMQKKYADILVQYGREVEKMQKLFEKDQNKPPISKGKPPRAGAISWSESIFRRTQRPILKFKTKEGLLQTQEGDEVKRKFFELSKQIRWMYQKDLIDKWQTEIEKTAHDSLKNSILVYEQDHYKVNFNESLKLLIREAKYMRSDLPQSILNIALQEDKYHQQVDQLKVMIKEYDDVVNSLKISEKKLLEQDIKKLQAELEPGLKSLNWSSLGIKSYIDKSKQQIALFKTTRASVAKFEEEIEKIVQNIENAILIRDFDWERGVKKIMEISDFTEYFDQHKNGVIEDLKEQYLQIGQRYLLKIEESTCATDTMCAPSMAEYYGFWERRIFNAIVKMVIRGLSVIKQLFSNSTDRPPLFKIRASYTPPEINYSPTIFEIERLMHKFINGVKESAENFPRWMKGHCRTVQPRKVDQSEDKKFIHTFFKDVAKVQHITNLEKDIKIDLDKMLKRLTKHTTNWKEQYENKFKLGNDRWKSQTEKQLEKKQNIIEFDRIFSMYSFVYTQTKEQEKLKRIMFIVIDGEEVQAVVCAAAKKTLQEFAEILRSISKKQLEAVEKEIQQFYTDLAELPRDIEKLKYILNKITQIKQADMNMEFRIKKIQEQFRTLEMYQKRIEPEKNIIEPEESEVSRKLWDRWSDLLLEAHKKDAKMLKTKLHFAEITKKDINNFLQEIEEIYKTYQTKGPGCEDTGLKEGVELLEYYKEKVTELNAKKEELVHASQLFNLPVTPFSQLATIEESNKQLSIIYGIYTEQQQQVQVWSSTQWSSLDFSSIEKETEIIEKKLRRLGPQLEGYITFRKLKEVVNGFKEAIPQINKLKHEAVKQRHWDKLMDLTGINAKINLKNITLSQVFELNLQKYEEKVDEIITEANAEASIENKLNKIEMTWKTTNFQMQQYFKNKTEFRSYILKGTDDIKTLVEDDITNIQQMSGSKFIAAFSDQVRKWDKALNTISEVIDQWMVVQRKWMYLEAIFIGAQDIKMQLKEASNRFIRIDKAFRKLMDQTYKNPNVYQTCYKDPMHYDETLNELKTLSADLDTAQKSLSNHLDNKKMSFPRFFFISPDELLSILGSSDPAAVQPHMLKLYDNCKELIFNRSKHVAGMISEEGESYSFRQNIKPEGSVEIWMNKVDEEMMDTLRAITKEAIFNYATSERIEWIKLQIGMVALAGTQIWWTWHVEDVFNKVRQGNKHAMKEESARETKDLNDLIDLVRQNVDRQLRKKINTLIILDVHARDIVDRFVRDSILDAKEFEWESQLRFYWEKYCDNMKIRQCTGIFDYCYEYQGLNGRLVITPLTDRCVMTLTTALTFHLGGAPAGPAGTGKTETVKDLAKSLAIRCVVTNCGEGLDFKAMGTIFTGLSMTGFWGCFDEFNRINPEVLSVVSAQIKSIQNALNQNRAKLDLQDVEISLKATVGIFVTMNPGYEGRSELPDNLKALFRPVTMIVPDLNLICENMLMAEGFNQARILARKMTVLYKLAREQLSKQYHYDFGLRALKSVLVMAGSLKRGSPNLNEDVVLMRALRDMNKPKFIFEDVPLFEGLIKDLFPGLQCEREGHEELKAIILEDMRSKGFQHTDEEKFLKQLDKVMQLYETMLTRHTTMVVGPTGAGKTVVIETLQRSLSQQKKEKVIIFWLNPKAITLSELYGELDPITRNWTDGLLSKIFRDANEPLGDKKQIHWILFDGDVDAYWVENLNSVMDDNRLLTLPNNERIRLEKYCFLLFEVFDLQWASPATISRCGMVWIDDKDLGYQPFYEKWATKKREIGEIIYDSLMVLFNRYIPNSLKRIVEGVQGDEIGQPLTFQFPTTQLNMVKQLTILIDSILPQENPPQEVEALENIFVFCMLWAFGGCLVQESRVIYEEFVRSSADRMFPPSTLYEHFYDLAAGWTNWKIKLQTGFSISRGQRFSEILVPTIDTWRYSFLLQKIMGQEKPCMFIGESGTSKTVIIQNTLESLPPEAFTLLRINFSSRTTSADCQRTIEDKVEKRPGKIFGPPVPTKLIVFIDDVNMPKVDRCGTQQPITLLRFLIDKGYFYEREPPLEKKILKDTQYVGAMHPPGGGVNSVDPRFISLFCCFGITFPSMDTIKYIYKNLLDKHFERDFDESIIHSTEKMIDGLLKLYNSIKEQLPRTPVKFHYIFNLRDLSRVIEGIFQATVDKFENQQQILRLWRNECERVFVDRLAQYKDKELVCGKLFTDIIKENWPQEIEYIMKDPCLFGDFMPAKPIDPELEKPRIYEDVGDYKRVKEKFQEMMNDYAEDHKPLDLVLFDYAVDHLTRIQRIIKIPRGNALLVGIGGSGKQSLTKLASFIATFQQFSITLSRGYNESNFREELKHLYEDLATKQVVFVFTDAHVVDEGFLELINNMLTIGMIPGLYAEEEKENLVSRVRDQARKQGIEKKDQQWNFFINKARDNLHIVLAMSPAGQTLRIRCRNFPGLINNTSIDWFFPWPEEALFEVADAYLHNISLPEEIRQNIVNHVVRVHSSALEYSTSFEQKLRRKIHSTPKNYLDFLQNYKVQLQENRQNIDDNVNRLTLGLEQLQKAAAQVQVMNVTLEKRNADVSVKKAEVEKMIQEITDNTIIANSKQAEATEKQGEITVQRAQIQEQQNSANKALQAAEPALLEAADALKCIEQKDITNIKGMANPPFLVKETCYFVAVLDPTGGKPADWDWGACKVMLGEMRLLKQCQEYEKDKIKESQYKKIKNRMALVSKQKELTPENVKSQSSAAFGLFKWVNAMLYYYEVNSSIEPIRRELRKYTAALEEAEASLAQINETLERLNREIAVLEKNKGEAEKELKLLSEEAETLARRLNAAKKLIEGLGEEQIRWTADSQKLVEDKTKLVGDCLLSCGFLCYSGPFNFEFRQQMIYENWKKYLAEKTIPHSEDFQISKLLTDDVEISRWAREGLPSDELSVQNGILTVKASRFPLCIDPQEQAVVWIRNKEAKSNLQKVSFNDTAFIKNLEGALRYGYTVIFENIDEEIDPIIDPILDKNIQVQAGQKIINFAGQPIEWDESFRLFLTTKLSNPQYSPEIFAKTAIINYTVTMQGLEEQLLNEVVLYEKPELEETRVRLVNQMAENQAIRKELEDKLLNELSNAQGSILDNEELIRTLDETKAKSVEIKIAIQEQVITKEENDKSRNGYRKAAKRGSILFFAMAGLSIISKMYEYSLDSYLSVFRKALQRAKKDNIIRIRLNNIIEKLTTLVYDYVCLGIFEKHKLLYSFQMTTMIMHYEPEFEIDLKELDFFLKGNTNLEGVRQPKPFTWLNDVGWKDLDRLVDLKEQFQSLRSDISNNEKVWKDWFNLEQPESAQLPLGYDSLNQFQKLLIIKILRPDRVYIALKEFIKATLNDHYITPPPLIYDEVFKQTTNKNPVVFILSPGADPYSNVYTLGEAYGFAPTKFKNLALGQGMGSQAQSMLTTGSQRGHWVMLQNCHLLPSWLKDLEKILEQTTKPHNDFRLWLTTDPSDTFPLTILQKSLKVVTEPPDGLMRNMKERWKQINNEQLSECESFAFRPLVFVLSFFHAVVQERKKYGKIGWNVVYDFNESDFRISMRLLKMYLNKAFENNDENLPWASLRYLIGEAMYGGRVTDSFDRRVLVTYLEEYMGDFIFDKNQPFFFAKSSIWEYKIPFVTKYEDYVSAIEEIPGYNSPEIFGLHSNAEIGYFTDSAKELWENMIKMQTSETSSGSGVDRDTYIEGVATDIQDKMPQIFDLLNIRKALGDIQSPCQVVLLQELERFNKLIGLMNQELFDLKRALKGEIGMSQELDDLSYCLYNAFLPNNWRKNSPQTQKKLGAWIEFFLRRNIQYIGWVQNGEPNVMWLSGLGIPESFLTALVQTTCRAKGWALDKSTLYSQVTNKIDPSQISEKLEHGSYITGLYLEGAKWNVEKGILSKQNPKELVSEMPVMQIIPVEINKLKLRGTLKTPVYITQNRRNAMGVGLVFEADLRIEEHESHWILQGVCMTLNVDY